MQPNLDQYIKPFANLANAVSAHNRGNGLGTALADAIGIAMGVKPDKTESPTNSAEAIFKKFNTVLNALGLELLSNHSAAVNQVLRENFDSAADKVKPDIPELDVTFLDFSRINTDKLSFGLVDNNTVKLTRFLKSISPRAAEDSALSEAIEMLSSSLNDHLLASYLLLNAGELKFDWDTLIDGLVEVSSELSRIGVTETESEFSINLEHCIDRTLVEYQIAREAQIIDNEEFNAASWHIDMIDTAYQERWDQALDTLEIIKMNPNAAKLFQDSVNFLDNAIAIARRDIGKNKSGDFENSCMRQFGNSMLETLVKAERRLTIIDL